MVLKEMSLTISYARKYYVHIHNTQWQHINLHSYRQLQVIDTVNM